MIENIVSENLFLAKIAYICLVNYYETQTEFVFEADNQTLKDVLHILSRWGLDREKITQPLNSIPRIVINKDSFRSCCVCGEPIVGSAYCYDGGYRYFCSSDCLSEHFTEDMWEQECSENEESYWSEWESPYFS